MIEKSGSARWSGGLKDGTGQVSTQSGLLKDEGYTFAKRFGDEAGTNPEELLAAAHAACFSMALSNILADYDLTADSIETTSTATLDPGKGAITAFHLELVARIPGASEDKFQEAANKAKDGCPVSKLLNAEITMEARLG